MIFFNENKINLKFFLDNLFMNLCEYNIYLVYLLFNHEFKINNYPKTHFCKNFK